MILAFVTVSWFMRVLICGGQMVGMVSASRRGEQRDISFELAGASSAREDIHNKLDELNARFGFKLVMLCGKGGAARLGLNWATNARLPVEDYRAKRFFTFRENEDALHTRLFTRGKPELLVDLSGGDYTRRLCLAAEQRGIAIIRHIAPVESAYGASPIGPAAARQHIHGNDEIRHRMGDDRRHEGSGGVTQPSI